MSSGSGQAMDGPSGLADTSSRATPATARSIEVPVLPNVARFMNERETPHPERWNLGVMLTPARRLRPESVRQVVAALSERHVRFGFASSASVPAVPPRSAPATDRPPFATSDLSGVAPMDRPSAVERRADELERSLDLEHGPLFRVELFDLGEQGQRLLVIVHHFVMDQLAWPTFWEDFETLYTGLERHTAIALPPPTTSFEDWARALERYADSEVLRAEYRPRSTCPGSTSGPSRSITQMASTRTRPRLTSSSCCRRSRPTRCSAGPRASFARRTSSSPRWRG